MRCNPYTLNGVDLHPLREGFFESAGIMPGDRIEVIGKKSTFELEGLTLTEIFVNKLRIAE